MKKTYILCCVVLALDVLHAYLLSRDTVFACPDESVTARCDTPDGVLKLESITIYYSTDTEMIVSRGKQCTQVDKTHQCERIISISDPGLSAETRYLFNWSKNKCEGKKRCDPVRLPEWWILTGDTTKPARTRKGTVCPQKGKKFFSGALFDFSCIGGENIVTKPALPPTTPKTRPTTPTTTPSFPVTFAVYLPGLNSRERILLGVAIGLAIAILIVLLTILYCWERWRKQKKFRKLLRMLGRPQAVDDGFDELNDYGTPEAWKDMTNNADAIGEYTGVKPDEFLTIDRKTMEKSGLIYSDHVGTITTMGRANTAATLNKNGTAKRPQVEAGTGYHNGAVDYETAENLELERRMAAALNQDDVLDVSDGEEVTRH